MTRDRRRHPRINATGPLRARFADQGLDLIVIDISVGGLRAESSTALAVGGDYVLEVSARNRVIRLTAEVVRCQLKALHPKPIFDVGFSFLDSENPATKRAVQSLLSELAAASQPLTM